MVESSKKNKWNSELWFQWTKFFGRKIGGCENSVCQSSNRLLGVQNESFDASSNRHTSDLNIFLRTTLYLPFAIRYMDFSNQKGQIKSYWVKSWKIDLEQMSKLGIKSKTRNQIGWLLE
jgi:hypothetical protein